MKRGRIYTVHYGADTSYTDQFVESVKPFLNKFIDLVIINNSSKEVSISYRHDFISTIDSDENRGYFEGVDFGMKAFPVKDLDYVIICNNDVKILSDNFFEILDSKLNTYDIIAPSIKTVDQVEQNPHLRVKPGLKRLFYYEVYYLSFYMAKLLDRAVRFKKTKTTKTIEQVDDQPVFSPHGAFIVIKNTYFKKGGTIDTGYFLYGEESSLASQAYKLKLSTYMVPELKILHFESVSTGKKFSRNKYKFQKNAYRYLNKKYPEVYRIW
jgi:GT2 family glycosyltransferase